VRAERLEGKVDSGLGLFEDFVFDVAGAEADVPAPFSESAVFIINLPELVSVC
jgi:hypothetical protein